MFTRFYAEIVRILAIDVSTQDEIRESIRSLVNSVLAGLAE